MPTCRSSSSMTARPTTPRLVRRRAGATVLRQVPNAGKGAALRTGFRHALDAGYAAAVTLDADGQHDPEEIPAFVDAFRERRPELIIGKRAFGEMPPARRLSNTLGGLTLVRCARPERARQPVRLPAHRSSPDAGDARKRGVRLRVRGRDDRPGDRTRAAHRVGADPHDLRRGAEPHRAVAPSSASSCGSPRRRGGSRAASSGRPRWSSAASRD